MKKLSISEWAAIGEIIATVGIFVSIGFLAYGINRNNQILQATNDNLIYELVGDAYGEVYGGQYLVPIRGKLVRGEGLTDEELDRYEYFLYMLFDIWELAFDRHADGLLSDQKWESWNKSFELELLPEPTGLPKEGWGESNLYGPEFTQHISEAYSRL